jgi:hypothetical protein
MNAEDLHGEERTKSARHARDGSPDSADSDGEGVHPNAITSDHSNNMDGITSHHSNDIDEITSNQASTARAMGLCIASACSSASRTFFFFFVITLTPRVE